MFATQVIPQYFDHNKFSSFARQVRPSRGFVLQLFTGAESKSLTRITSARNS